MICVKADLFSTNRIQDINQLSNAYFNIATVNAVI